MPIQKFEPPKWTSPKELEAEYNTWRKGLNTLLRKSEVDKAELTQMDNLFLIGSGIPTKRWGSEDYFLSGVTGYGRGLIPIKNATNDNIEVLAITDWGFLTKKNNVSYTMITGASWASGYNVEGTQLANNVYLVSEQREMVRYDFTSLTGFPTLAIPTSLSASNISGATGLTTWSWRVTATSRVGETLGATAISLASLPQDLSKTLIRVFWTGISAASGDLVGYNIYRGQPGDEQWVGGVGNETTRFDDFGALPADPFRVTPDADSTGGIKAKYIIRFQDRLVMAGLTGEPTKVIITGRAPFHERIDWVSGGGVIEIEPDSGENVTGLATYQQSSTSTQTIIVFKEKSVWELKLVNATLGMFTFLDPQYRLLTASQGCSSHRSIKAVENDIMFANRSGIYILRYEPQLLNVINANELSAKIRPFFEAQTDSDHLNSSADYINKKYVLSYPTAKKTIIFDRERLSFSGPMITPFGINKWASYLDADGIERWIAIDSGDEFTTLFRPGLSTDKGTAIKTVLKTRKEDFGDWTVFKTINEIYSLFRNVQGTVNVNIFLEERSGATIVAKTFSITSQVGISGMGTDQLGMIQMGLTESSPSISSDEAPKATLLYKNARTIQLEITTTGASDSYELISLKMFGFGQPRQALNAWRTS